MLILSSLIPTHDAGERQTATGRWVSCRDAVAWHEAAHAVVFRALGVGILGVSIDPVLAARIAGKGKGYCHTADMNEFDEETKHRVKAIGAMAGPIATNAVRRGLGVAEDFLGTESLSVIDAADVDAANEALPEGGPDFESRCQHQAMTIIFERQEAYAATVAALLEHETLEAEAFAALLADHPI
jgi:hypothetical protein